MLALAALLSWFALTAALLTTLVAPTLLLTALAGFVLVWFLLAALVGIVCLVHRLLLCPHINGNVDQLRNVPSTKSSSGCVK